MSILSVSQVNEAELVDWALLREALHTRLRTRSWEVGIALVNAISKIAQEADHHPDLDLRYGHLDVRLSSHDVGGVTGRDVRMARRISALAVEAGVSAGAEALSVVEMALDTPDAGSVRPFWNAVLAGQQAAADDEVRDDSSRTPSLWFQASGHAEPRQRFHLDVTVPASQAQARIDAALRAGGRIVSDAEAPAFVVLADAEGNRVCICTMEGR